MIGARDEDRAYRANINAPLKSPIIDASLKRRARLRITTVQYQDKRDL
jgi:hypothetical protein